MTGKVRGKLAKMLFFREKSGNSILASFSFCNAHWGFVWCPIGLKLVSNLFFYSGEHFEKKKFWIWLAHIVYVQKMTRLQKHLLFFKSFDKFFLAYLSIEYDILRPNGSIKNFWNFWLTSFPRQRGLKLKKSRKIDFFGFSIFFDVFL